MRNTILIAFVLLIHTSAFAQKWALPSSTWIVSYSWMSPTYYTTIKVEGDTTIDGFSCKKIGNTSPIYTYESNDTAYIHIAGKFRPTYYFNANVGDTISFYNANYSDGFCGIDSIVYAVVDKIDSIDVGNKFLRKFCGTLIGDTSTPNCNGFSYTEYIGSNFIFPYIYCPNIVDQESYGICNYGDSTIQNFYAFQNTCLNVSVGNTISPDEYLLIFPNPTTNFLSVISNADAISDLTLFDLQGREVQHDKEIVTPNYIKLNLNNIPKGLYYVHISSWNGQHRTKKFLKE